MNFRIIDIEKDKDLLIKFRKDTYIHSFGTDEGFDEIGYINRMEERVNKCPSGQLIVEEDNTPIGQIGLGIVDYCGTQIGYINLIYLLSDYRGKGLGKDLITNAENFFRDMNVSEYHLRVSSTNQRAIQLYTNSGMVKLREENKGQPVLRMKKIL
ncbi:GNAT family N-acetyltransferase [Bacillus salipaludis]|uniref:GNAT family N-acetyltransferase n=1 Tax=Bacillus salipaludis TaxID=2547811 RepID=A0A4R5VJE3_9BACI|nr:GNAT family N-acetyltransferase [Bacillus salipaludis]MDQ6596478.1 GNAT family N-acetyltransferase [Bacillus salipaludis]TDK57120.1 GNAT family N-acetyltransferase [Bacillus salipaludis]